MVTSLPTSPFFDSITNGKIAPQDLERRIRTFVTQLERQPEGFPVPQFEESLPPNIPNDGKLFYEDRGVLVPLRNYKGRQVELCGHAHSPTSWGEWDSIIRSLDNEDARRIFLRINEVIHRDLEKLLESPREEMPKHPVMPLITFQSRYRLECYQFASEEQRQVAQSIIHKILDPTEKVLTSAHTDRWPNEGKQVVVPSNAYWAAGHLLIYSLPQEQKENPQGAWVNTTLKLLDALEEKGFLWGFGPTLYALCGNPEKSLEAYALRVDKCRITPVWGQAVEMSIGQGGFVHQGVTFLTSIPTNLLDKKMLPPDFDFNAALSNYLQGDKLNAALHGLKGQFHFRLNHSIYLKDAAALKTIQYWKQNPLFQGITP